MLQEDRYGLRAVQEQYLDMLRDFDRFCRENGICYSIDSGTLLGAIRHHGFIPWDDDADIVFDRPNYDRFLKIADKMEGYQIVGRRWIKRLAKDDPSVPYKDLPCIDLFVFDGIPKNKALSFVKIYVLYLLQGMLKVDIDYSKYSFKQKFLIGATHVLGLPFSRRWKQKAYDRVSRWGGDNTPYIKVYNTRFSFVKDLCFDRDMISDYVMLDFEDASFMALKGYEQYLTGLYGDYMQLPPEEKRRPVHRQ